MIDSVRIERFGECGGPADEPDPYEAANEADAITIAADALRRDGTRQARVADLVGPDEILVVSFAGRAGNGKR